MALTDYLNYFDQFIIDNDKTVVKERTGTGTVDRRLGERSFLDFRFPDRRGSATALSVTLPFLENVQISEKKRARYQRFQPVSRSSDLYTYLGADSRKISLKFHLTLKHIEADGPNITDFMNALTNSQDSYEEIRQRFKGNSTTPPESQSEQVITSYLTDVRESAQAVKDSWVRFLSWGEQLNFQTRYTLPQGDSFEPAGPLEANKDWITTNSEESVAKRSKVIDMVIYWVNLIRSSVVNNAMNPTLGPPIIRLNHGIMYQDVPCICTDYSLEPDANAALDMDTLLPQRISITMALEEIRTGNFGQFREDPKDAQTRMVTRDNLAGWESVIVHNTMDPGKI
jgi:hypothetical protein